LLMGTTGTPLAILMNTSIKEGIFQQKKLA
jgi:hypothetical protein